MTDFEVRADGSIVGDPQALRRVTAWMVRRYRSDVGANGGGGGSALLMGFIAACGESVRLQEVLGTGGVALAEPQDAGYPILEVSATEAAARMGCSVAWIRRLAQRGELPARKVGRDWLIDSSYLDRQTPRRAA